VSSTQSHKNAVGRYRERHLEQGLCVDCPEPAKPGKIRCRYHAAYHRDINNRNNQKYTRMRLENNLCSRCGTPLIEGEATRCVNCRMDDMVRGD
jgi:hypothetical protein